MNKTNMVLEHLKKEGSITSWEAITLYRATRLSDIVYKLKARGYAIDTIMKEGDGTRYAEYVWRN